MKTGPQARILDIWQRWVRLSGEEPTPRQIARMELARGTPVDDMALIRRTLEELRQTGQLVTKEEPGS